ncbi:hypothetical protein [Kribbella sp. NBC_00889]|nr:hypothetical protein OG817_26470 [Kribbella sp. NBC_00889]
MDQHRAKQAAESLLRMAHALTARLGGPVHAPVTVDSVPLKNRRS